MSSVETQEPRKGKWWIGLLGGLCGGDIGVLFPTDARPSILTLLRTAWIMPRIFFFEGEQVKRDYLPARETS